MRNPKNGDVFSWGQHGTKAAEAKGSHYHVILETSQGNLSQIMKHINSSCTTSYNVKRKQAGHLLQERYKAIIVNADEYAQNFRVISTRTGQGPESQKTLQNTAVRAIALIQETLLHLLGSE